MAAKGFLVLAQGEEYVRQAYALALSIKLSQPIYNSISLVTNDPVPEKYYEVFENIIEIPWNDEADKSEWKVENRWKLIHASPYEETIVLDSDMLFFKDVTFVWKHLENYELFFVNKVLDYRGNTIVDKVNRKMFLENQLPNIYFAFHYFKKTPKAFEFYKTLELVVHNWEYFYGTFAPKERQNWLSMDVSAAVALKILGIEDEVINQDLNITFVHLKPNVQNWRPVPAKWTDVASFYFNRHAELFINQFKQLEIIHYTENEFLNADVITMLEEKYDN